jgi:glucokinase
VPSDVPPHGVAPAEEPETSHPGTAFAAVDVGGTTIKSALITDTGDVLIQPPVATGAGQDALDNVEGVLRRLIAAAAGRGAEVESAGLAVPGLVDPAGGTVRYAANLGWTDLPLRRRLNSEFHLRVGVENDARAGAAAHLAVHAATHPAGPRTGPTATGAGGAAREAGGARPRSFVFIPIGTGVSAGVVLDGVVLAGATGAGGEFGHVPVLPGGEVCGCGARGCLEAYASGAGVARRYQVSSGDTRQVSAADVVSRLGSDVHADEVWSQAVRALALGLAGLTALLDPQRVVLGGGVAHAGARLLDPLRRDLQALLPWRPAPEVLLSPFGDRATLVGAAALAIGRRGTPEHRSYLLRRLAAQP